MDWAAKLPSASATRGMIARVAAESVNPAAIILARRLSLMLKVLKVFPPYSAPHLGALQLLLSCLENRGQTRARTSEARLSSSKRRRRKRSSGKEELAGLVDYQLEDGVWLKEIAGVPQELAAQERNQQEGERATQVRTRPTKARSRTTRSATRGGWHRRHGTGEGQRLRQPVVDAARRGGGEVEDRGVLFHGEEVVVRDLRNKPALLLRSRRHPRWAHRGGLLAAHARSWSGHHRRRTREGGAALGCRQSGSGREA